MAKSDDDSDQDRKLPARKSKLNTDDVSTGSDMTPSFRKIAISPRGKKSPAGRKKKTVSSSSPRARAAGKRKQTNDRPASEEESVSSSETSKPPNPLHGFKYHSQDSRQELKIVSTKGARKISKTQASRFLVEPPKVSHQRSSSGE